MSNDNVHFESMVPVSRADVYQKQSFADVLQNRCACKFRKFHRKAPLLESPFNKVASPTAYKFIEKRLKHRWFPVKFLRKSFFTEQLWWLFVVYGCLHRLNLFWDPTWQFFPFGVIIPNTKDVRYYYYICPCLLIATGEIINKLSFEELKSVQINYFSGTVIVARYLVWESYLELCQTSMMVLFAKIMKRSGALVHSCSLKKVFLEISQNSQENTCARVSFLIELQASGLQLY